MGIDVRDSVVVVTGASSGIGRATAQALARQGASVVLAARGSEDLQQATEECRFWGGQAMAIPTDVTDEGQVRELADRALTIHGHIDGWINNAGVTLFGRIEEVPAEAFRRVIDTNLLGYVYGARAAIPIFREQGAGVLVNVASMAACIGQPYASAYVASKWAVRGLSESLRMELQDAPQIAVCTVLPGVIDTPILQHAGNFTGRGLQPAGQARPAGEVAKVIVDLLSRPRREVFVGVGGAILQVAKLVAPGMVERRMAERVEKGHFEGQATAPSTGNLYAAQPGAVSGSWRRRSQPSRRRRLALVSVAAALATIPLGYLAWRQVQGRV